MAHSILTMSLVEPTQVHYIRSFLTLLNMTFFGTISLSFLCHNNAVFGFFPKVKIIRYLIVLGVK